MMASAGENSARISQAKKMIANVIVGFIILLSAWLIVDTFMKMFVDDAKVGVWSRIACVEQPKFSWSPVEDASRGVSPSSPSATTLPAAVAAVGTYANQLCDIARNASLGGECASLEAIMTQESGGNPSAVSSAGAIGLMQVTPAAARSLDPSLKGLSDEQVRQKLLDPMYNMQVAVAYYKMVTDQVGVTDYDSIYAAYNGGLGAIGPSKDCPGLERWQCVWDSPGCYGTSLTNCIPNTGYRETRDYVAKVNSYRTMYVSQTQKQ
jgi:hypothetical protein